MQKMKSLVIIPTFLLLVAAAPEAPMPVAPVAPAMAAKESKPVAPPPTAQPATMQPAPASMAVAASPSSAPAAPTGKKDSLGSTIGGALLQILILILTIALPVVLTPLVRWLLAKMKVENLQTQQMIDDTVDKAVIIGLNYANEQAYKLRDNPIGSAEKLNVATTKALEYLKDSGIVGKGAEYIAGLIESKLGVTRTDEDLQPTAPVAKTEEKPVEPKPAVDSDKSKDANEK